MSAKRIVDGLNEVVGKWRRNIERKRKLEPYNARRAIPAEVVEYNPPTEESTTP